MAEDVAVTVARLKARCDQARDARIRAEHDKAAAEKGLDDAVAALKAEFGIETPDQARQLAVDLDSQIAAEARKIEEALG